VQIRAANRGKGDAHDRLSDSRLRFGDLFDSELLYASEHIRSHCFFFSHFNLLLTVFCSCLIEQRRCRMNVVAERGIHRAYPREEGDFTHTLGGFTHFNVWK